MNRSHLRLLVFCLLALVAFAGVGIALAESGAVIGWQVIAGGGAPASSDNITLNDALGQPIIGPSGGGNISLGAGHWYGLGYDETKCDLAEGNTYAYNQTWPVSVTLQTEGTLDCLRVRRYDQNHPGRTGASAGSNGVGWGRYWTITATDSVSATASGFTLTLTLPHDGLTAPRSCRHISNLVWDCDDGSHTTFTASTVTRSGITSLSDWAVGEAVGPTATTLSRLSATSLDVERRLKSALLALAALTMIGTVLIIGRQRSTIKH